MEKDLFPHLLTVMYDDLAKYQSKQQRGINTFTLNFCLIVVDINRSVLY